MFIRSSSIDKQYKVEFFLYSDELSETYRVKTLDNELKLFKLIKPDALSLINLAELRESIQNYATDSVEGVLSYSELSSFQHNNETLYYYTLTFLAGETLIQLLELEIYFAVYKA